MPGDTVSRWDGSRAVPRRAVLAGAATVLGGGTVLATPVRGQVTVPAVIPRPDRWAEENLAGFMIHVGGRTDPAELGAARNCAFEGWPPGNTLAYDATLINRKQGDTPEEGTILYIGAGESVPAGALYLVNTFERCETDYVGVELERIGRFDVGEAGREGDRDVGPVEEVEEDERPNTRSPDGPGGGDGGGGFGAVGPGFGVPATVAGLLGGGAILRRLNSGDDDI